MSLCQNTSLRASMSHTAACTLNHLKIKSVHAEWGRRSAHEWGQHIQLCSSLPQGTSQLPDGEGHATGAWTQTGRGSQSAAAGRCASFTQPSLWPLLDILPAQKAKDRCAHAFPRFAADACREKSDTTAEAAAMLNSRVCCGVCAADSKSLLLGMASQPAECGAGTAYIH